MATVTGLTAARMLEIEAASVVDGDVVDDELILTRHDGTQINAGSVVGPTGPAGPPSADLSVLAAQPILDIGMSGQIRAGRQFEVADFTDMGLSAPIGLWNLGSLLDVSGHGRNLLNKGSVAFDVGIHGLATTGARFNGVSTQALYIPDSGSDSDPFRIRAGSWGCWFRTSRKGANQTLMSKDTDPATSTQTQFILAIDDTTGHLLATIGDGASGTLNTIMEGDTDVTDDRWHFVVFTYDGSHQQLYLDGKLEMAGSLVRLGGVSSGPFNIGARYANASVTATAPHYGLIDEAFVTADILTEDQVRNLYCTRIAHALADIPNRFSLNVHRFRRGIPFLSAYFPTQPLRLYNFSAGALGDIGSNGVTLTKSATAGTPTRPLTAPGADGTADNAYDFDTFSGSPATLLSVDTGLPSGLNARSYGCWFKTATLPGPGQQMSIIQYGQATSNHIRLYVNTAGELVSDNGTDSMPTTVLDPTGAVGQVADRRWHFVVVVEDNSAANGVKRKCYVDGRLAGSSQVLNSISLAGSSGFIIGNDGGAGVSQFHGQIDTVFVCNYALTLSEILSLYARGTQEAGPSPLNSADFIEGVTDTDILADFSSLDSTHQISLAVSA